MRRAFGKKWLAGILVAAVIAVAMIQVQTAQAAEYWKGKFVRFYATAGESLALGDVVCLAGSDSRAYKADADDDSLRVAIGVVGAAATAGDAVEVVISGIITGQEAASAGSRVYLDTTAGGMTTTSGNEWGQVLGVVIEGTAAEVAADESTTYLLSVQPLSASGVPYY